MKLTFRFKIFLHFLLIVLITSFPIAVISYNYIYDSLKEDMFKSTEAQMVQIDNTIYSTINKMKENDKFLANIVEVKKADQSIQALFNMPDVETNKKYSKQIQGLESNIYNYFENYATSHPETTYAFLGTKWGGYIQWPDGLGSNKYDPRQRPWYTLAMENPDEVMVSTPHIPAIDDSNNVIVSASTTVRNDNGNIIGVVGIDMSLEKLSEMIRDIKIGDAGYIFLYLKDGTMLAHPDTKLNFKNISELNQLGNLKDESNVSTKFIVEGYNNLIELDNGRFESSINGTSVIVNVYTSPETGWKMASVIPKSELLGKANKIAYLIATISLLALIFVIILSLFITKRITKPIKELTPLMQAAGNGDFSVTANINSKDEFGELSKSFNLMIGKLRKSYEELAAVYEELVATEEELHLQFDELQMSEEALKNSEERYKLALECANDSIFEYDIDTGEFYVSDKFTNITGYKIDKINSLYRFSVDFIHPDDRKKAKEEFSNHIWSITSDYNSEFRIKTINGSYVWILCRGRAIRDSHDKVVKFAGSISDITDRKNSEEKVRYMAFYDSLTSLPNRTSFINKLEKQLELAERKEVEGAVFFIDLDNFKNINDTIGHDYGDKLLIQLGKLFEELVGKNETVCRFGGDEFILLHSYIKESEVKVYAEQLLKVFNENFCIDGRQVYITASIGIALYPKDGTDTNTILRNADSAMYKAKELGRNRYALYDPEMYIKLERKTTIERILRSSIVNNELSINYQPQYDAESNEIFGFEALLRLNSRELGFISPYEFIPIAEETGFITELGKWVLRESCRQSVKWLNAGYKFNSMSINISSVDLQQPDFVQSVGKILKETGIDPRIVELEITETVLMKSFDSSIEKLKELMNIGIRVALDDFGTGYSSLNYLRKIPINTLKIDKSFIDNIACSKKEESIIKNIIQMAHSMSLKVVAEGVEIEEQLKVLKQRKCDYIQGYYFSKPLPAEEIEELLIK